MKLSHPESRRKRKERGRANTGLKNSTRKDVNGAVPGQDWKPRRAKEGGEEKPDKRRGFREDMRVAFGRRGAGTPGHNAAAI